MMTVVNTPGKQRGRPWKPGQSGNPSGKPKGARHKVTQAAQILLDGQGEALTQKCIDLALDGDVVALRLCLERFIPARKDRPLTIKLPAMKEAGDMVKVSAAIIRAVAQGALLPSEGEAMCRMVELHRRVIEVEEILSRLEALENEAGNQ
jgi:hypothetical protein